MKVGFAGTPEFARIALQAIVEAGFDVPLALSQPDRPAGRGLKLHASPVKQFAAARGVPVLQPRSLRLDGKFADDAASARQALIDAALDVLVVAAYGLILPTWALALPKLGCINIHASLLPRWRGAAPIQRAIEAGDAKTGITIMQMDAGLDTGPMLLRQALPIAAEETSASLHDKLAGLGGELVVRALREITSLPPTVQPADGASYAHKIDKAEAAIDWAQPAAAVERRARAFDPFPGCSFTLGGETIKLWRARLAEGQGAPGCVPGCVLGGGGEGRLLVACGSGAVEVLELQRNGGRRLAAGDFLRGHPVAPGTVLGSSAA